MVVSDSVVSEQEKSIRGKYPKVASLEEIMEEFKCFATDAPNVMTERVNEVVVENSANLHGANLAVFDVSMGAGRVEACC